MCLGIPAKIQRITDKSRGLALAQTNGVSRTVNVSLLTLQGDRIETLIDKWVLLHVGFAMTIIDENEALRSLTIFSAIGERDHD